MDYKEKFNMLADKRNGDRSENIKVFFSIQNEFWWIRVGIDLITKQFFIEHPITGSHISMFSLTEKSACQFKGIRPYKPNKLFKLIKEDSGWYLIDLKLQKSGIYKEESYKIRILTPIQALVVKQIQKGNYD